MSLSLPILLAVLGATDGRLEPAVEISGTKTTCRFTATSRETKDVVESATGAGLDLTAGLYDLMVECPHEGGTLVGFREKVRVQAGKTANPTLELKPAKVRVEARRNGQLLPARVALYAPRKSLALRLQRISANLSQTVAAGRYDVLVVLDDPRSPSAEALIENARIGGSKTTVLEADLSDGGLVVTATDNGRSAAASVRAFRIGKSKDAGLVETGQELRLPPGRYLVSTELRSSSDFSTKKREVWIRAGRTARIRERFETGRLSVTVTQDGRPVDATVRMAKQGASDFFNYFPAPGTVSLGPGLYDLTIVSKAAGPLEKVVEKDVRVRARGHTRKVVDLTPATLSVRVEKNGRPAEAVLTVRAAGGGASVEPENDGTWRLWPGRYEILAKLEDGSEEVDGPFEARLKQRIRRRIAFERALLTVRTLRGKAVDTDAQVFIFRPGATKPTARALGGAQIEVPPGVYDIKIVDGADTVWKQGVRVRRVNKIDVALPAKAIGEELPEGDLLPPGEDLPEGDADG